MAGTLEGALRRASAAFDGERERWGLWTPVLFGLGIAVYFALPVEPPLGACLAGLAALCALAVALRRHPAALLAALALLAVAAGFTRITLRSETVAAPLLVREIGPTVVRGRVLRVEERGTRVRLLLERVEIAGLTAAATPARVRVTASAGDKLPRPGQVVALRARLSPPSPPVAPGAFDFARQAYFQRIGAVGFAYGAARPVAEPDGTGLSVAIERLRRAITGRILAALAPPAGGVATALITGERGAIPEDVLKAMRDSGLAHLLAISGLHMGLVTGILFFAIRLGLALWEGVALRRPIKKWAALAAFAGASVYLVISGASVPTQRAYVMVVIALIAILFDRSPISMRLVAWAAGAVLLFRPESLISVSFQMSFAAVVALIAVYEAAAPRLTALRADRSMLGLATVYLAGILLSTLVASLATAPFAAYHFNRIAVFSLLANLIAMPLAGLWIMPCAIAALVLMPLGLEGLALTPMGWGIDLLIEAAGFVADLPRSTFAVPAFPLAALCLMVTGGLWLCLWRTRWRRIGVAGIAAGLIAVSLTRPPDILVDASGRLAAIRGTDGSLHMSSARVGRFERDTWLRLVGAAEAATWSSRGPDDGVALRCDALGCIYRTGGRTVAFVRRRDAVREDCAEADILISALWIKPWRCRGPDVLIDGFRLHYKGAHAIWLRDGVVTVESVGARRGDRPWTRRRKR